MYKPKLVIILGIIGIISIILLSPAKVTATNVSYPKGNPAIWIASASIQCGKTVSATFQGHDICNGRQEGMCHFTLSTWAYYQTNNFGWIANPISDWINPDNPYHFGQLRERYTMTGDCLNLTIDHPMET